MTSVTVEPDLELRTRDGVVLRADAWRPQGPGRWPVLLMRVPYGRTAAHTVNLPHPSWFARRGYAVVVQDTRGRYASDGTFEPFRHEADDGEETVHWASALAFGNGRVGMYGFSYSGLTQLHAASRNPPGLRCICAGMTAADPYTGWVFNKGAFSLAFNVSWATMMARDTAARARDSARTGALAAAVHALPMSYDTLPLSAVPHLGADGPGAFFQEWLRHESADAFWQSADVSAALPGVDAAVMTYAGLSDVFLESTLAVYAGVRAGGRTHHGPLVIGPWYHIPWSSFTAQRDLGPAAGPGRLERRQSDFLDQWLRDADEPPGLPIDVFVTGEGRWRQLASWPPPTREWSLHLHSLGRANSLDGDGWLAEEPPEDDEEADVFVHDPLAPVPSLGGRSCCFPHISPMGSVDQRPVEAMRSVLVYTSPPLERDRLLLGSAEVELFAATTAEDTDWMVKVCDVTPDGSAFNVQESLQRAKFAQGYDGSVLIPPGTVTAFRIRVGTLAHLMRRGHRVRLEVASSNFPHWDRNLGTGHPLGVDTRSDAVVAVQTVLHDRAHPSRLVLPLAEA